MTRKLLKKNNRRLYSMAVTVILYNLYIATKSKLAYHLQAGVPKKRDVARHFYVLNSKLNGIQVIQTVEKTVRKRQP